jgi:hypothetical protein
MFSVVPLFVYYTREAREAHSWQAAGNSLGRRLAIG